MGVPVIVKTALPPLQTVALTGEMDAVGKALMVIVVSADCTTAVERQGILLVNSALILSPLAKLTESVVPV